MRKKPIIVIDESKKRIDLVLFIKQSGIRNGRLYLCRYNNGEMKWVDSAPRYLIQQYKNRVSMETAIEGNAKEEIKVDHQVIRKNENDKQVIEKNKVNDEVIKLMKSNANDKVVKEDEIKSKTKKVTLKVIPKDEESKGKVVVENMKIKIKK